jgi:dCTP deaminase
MSVLTRRDFEERLKLPITDPFSMVITPLPPQDAFTEDSIDLRLGTHFLLPQIPPQPYIDPGESDDSRNYLPLHSPLGNYFVLPAHQTVLGATLEFIKLPFDVSGEILTKSSVARTFMIIETAPWVHPLYRGCLTLEIANASNTAILLYPGMQIGQLILIETAQKSREENNLLAKLVPSIWRRQSARKQSSEKLSGSYIGPVYPEAPRLKRPQEMLEQMGLANCRRPGYGWVNNRRMQAQLEEVSRELNPTERAKVSAVIRIITEHGGLNPESPASDLFR